jgi:hypothetical protein
MFIRCPDPNDGADYIIRTSTQDDADYIAELYVETWSDSERFDVSVDVNETLEGLFDQMAQQCIIGQEEDETEEEYRERYHMFFKEYKEISPESVTELVLRYNGIDDDCDDDEMEELIDSFLDDAIVAGCGFVMED